MVVENWFIPRLPQFWEKNINNHKFSLQTPPSLIDLVSESSFSSKPSKHHYNQTVRARELKFWENVHQKSHVRCHVSSVTCQVSPVTYIFFFYFFFPTKWKVCYQRGISLHLRTEILRSKKHCKYLKFNPIWLWKVISRWFLVLDAGTGQFIKGCRH